MIPILLTIFMPGLPLFYYYRNKLLYYISLGLYTLGSIIPLPFMFILTKNLRYKLFLTYNHVFCKLFNFKFEIDKHSLEKFNSDEVVKNRYIIVLNHCSQFDYLLSFYIKRRTIAAIKKEIMYYPFFGCLSYAMGQIFIDRKNPQGIITHIKDSLQKESDANFLIFPEGTINYHKDLLRFKNGAFILAKELDMKILLATIDAKDVINDEKEEVYYGGTFRAKFVEIVDPKHSDFNTENRENDIKLLNEYCHTKISENLFK